MGRVAFRIRIKYAGLERKVSRAKAALPEEAKRELTKLAEQAVALVRNADSGLYHSHAIQNIGRQLSFVFVPVQLKHKRKETWPNLQPIYNARVIRGQSRYQGRRVFYVDEKKEEAFFDKLVDAARDQQKDAEYDVRFSVTYDKRFRVEIIRRGSGKGKNRIPPVLVAFARTEMKELADRTAAQTMKRAGLV